MVKLALTTPTRLKLLVSVVLEAAMMTTVMATVMATLLALLIATARAARAAAARRCMSATSMVFLLLLLSVLRSAILQLHLVELLAQHLDQLVNASVSVLGLQVHFAIPLSRQASNQLAHHQTLFRLVVQVLVGATNVLLQLFLGHFLELSDLLSLLLSAFMQTLVDLADLFDQFRLQHRVRIVDVLHVDLEGDLVLLKESV